MSSNDSEVASNTTMEVCVKLPSSVVNAAPSKKKSKSINEVKLQLPRDAKVQNILEALAFTHSTRYLTNIDLKFGKTVLKDFEVLGEIAGTQGNLNLEIDLRHYCIRDVLKHVLMLREYLGFSSETVDGLSEFAISTGSKFHQMGLSEVKQEKEESQSEEDSNEAKKNVLKVSEGEKSDLERIIKDIFVSIKRSTVSEVNTSECSIITPCLRSLSLSPYNPVPPSYRSKGHLLYLQAVTLEGETFHITASHLGFFVNKSTSTRFDPSPKDLDNDGKCQIKHTLFDLLSIHSKKLAGHVEAFEKKVKEYNPISYIKPVNSFLHKPWMTSTIPSYNGDYLRLQLDSLSFETERNFNDEFQAIKDLSSTTLQSRLDSEKLLAKIINEFTVAATRGSMSILYDDFVAMNPDALKEEQIFLKDNIFYSFITDVSGAFTSKGGYEAAIAASNQDLRTVNLLNRLGTQEIRYLLSTIVEFAGRRILAQTPVPGLLSTMGTKILEEKENGENVVEDLQNDITVNYGFDESTGKVIASAEFDEAIQKEIGKVFHLKTHKVDDAQITLSSQSKGIIGFDKRKYILDLANTCPLDINFVREFYDNVEPAKQYPHRQTLLRPELVEKWWQHKFQKEGLDYKTAFEENKFSFNPDAYQVDGVKDQTVDEISDYLANVVIPGIIEDYSTGNITAPYNGEHVVENLHINGVNVRYLGKLVNLAKESLEAQNKKYAEKLNAVVDGNREHENWEKDYLLKIERMIKERQEEINKYIQEGKDVPKELTENIKLPEEDIRKPTKENPYIVSKDELLPLIFAGELAIISRSVKHILRDYTREIPIVLVPSLVAFFFNLLFGITYNAEPGLEGEEDLCSTKNFQLSQLTRSDLLNEISKQAFLRFRYELPLDWIDVHMAAPYALIRSICYQFGIQLANREYYFSKEQLDMTNHAKEKKYQILKPLTTFTADDITVIPLVKPSEFDSIVGDELWAQGAATIEKDQTVALNILSQSIAIKEDVSSALHKSVAEKYLALSTIYNSCGRLSAAVSFTRKACMIYERVCGIDSFEVLRTLSNLAVLEFSNDSVVNAALVYKRIVNTVQSLNLVATHHPIVVSALNHLEQIALGIEDPRLAIEILKHLSEIVASLDGKKSLAFAYVESRIGNLYATLNIMPRALEHIAATKDIFAEQLGINHELTAQAKQWNEGLTNLIKNKQRQQTLQKEQSKVEASDSKAQKKASHGEKPNAELASKSVDELLSFIEGGSEETSRKTKNKTKKNKNKSKNK